MFCTRLNYWDRLVDLWEVAEGEAKFIKRSGLDVNYCGYCNGMRPFEEDEINGLKPWYI